MAGVNLWNNASICYNLLKQSFFLQFNTLSVAIPADIYDPREGIAGTLVTGKKTPLNNKGIRVMTPDEWGKLQSFVNYAFIDENGTDTFSFFAEVPDAQRYKQFGNSVTIPVIEEMAKFIIACLEQLKL